MSIKPLIVKKPDRVKGLRPWYMKCRREIGNQKCGATGKIIRSCTSTELHTYKALVSVPGAKRKVKTKELHTRDLKEAIILRSDFEQELKAQEYQTTRNHLPKESTKPELLVECMASYLAFLNNVDVEAHMIKERSKKHLWEVENYFAKFCKALKREGICHTILRIDELNNRVVAHFHSYILEELKHKNKTYNKMMALMRQFVDWLIHQKGYEISNPFKLVQKKRKSR